ncbi:MAG: hypothetical protein DRP84_02905 [Spirochaetes bacterium]|nr:MAG: hypothetical protein DRP84_02905 [Spirochaetota bacterium]
MGNGKERRKFIRHPLAYPISAIVEGIDRESDKEKTEIKSESEDICEGGLLFKSEKKLEKGTKILVEVEVEGRKIRTEGTVVRCIQDEKGKFNIAVSFFTPQESLKVRMMEQIVRIELFKKRFERRYGVKVDFACIAREWIKRYSRAFAKHY